MYVPTLVSAVGDCLALLAGMAWSTNLEPLFAFLLVFCVSFSRENCEPLEGANQQLLISYNLNRMACVRVCMCVPVRVHVEREDLSAT